jgi:hypothetical protein
MLKLKMPNLEKPKNKNKLGVHYGICIAYFFLVTCIIC